MWTYCRNQNVDDLDSTAQTIPDKLREIFHDLDTPLREVVCFSSDGGSVMLGRVNGGAKKLRELNPAMVCVHCTALAVSQPTNGIIFYHVYNHVHYCAVRYNCLHKIIEWHSIHWLSLQKTVATIIKICCRHP